MCCRSQQCLQLAQDQAVVRRLSRYVNSDSAAAHALLPEQPRARSCYATELLSQKDGGSLDVRCDASQRRICYGYRNRQKRCFVFFGPWPVATLTMRTPTHALTGLPGLCLLCVSRAAGDVRPHLVFECAALASLRSMYLTDIGISFTT